MTRRRLAAAALALGLVAAACATDGGDTDAATASDDSAEASEQAVSAEPIALTVATSDGGTIDFADLAGEDVMLWFWAPW